MSEKQQSFEPGRRAVLAGLALGGAAVVAGPGAPAAAVAAQPTIRPRSDWATAQPTGPLGVEEMQDVKFLLIHHTETGNDYSAERVPRILMSMFNYHTGDKGWNDIAYNFLIDKYGTIWEGRAGSIENPVKGDATAGSQGHAMLCCFIGNHTSVEPTAKAQQSMTALLAWLAGKYSIDLNAGKTITFVSRGSNLHPAGKTVTTTPVAGHRDMSQTACPGDACYPLVTGALLTGAQALAGRTVAPSASAPAATPAAPSSDPTAPATQSPVPVPSAESLPITTSSPAPAPANTGAGRRPLPPPDSGEVTVEDGINPMIAVVGGGAATALGLGAAAVLLNRRKQGRELGAEMADHGNPEPPKPPEAPEPPRDRNSAW